MTARWEEDPCYSRWYACIPEFVVVVVVIAVVVIVVILVTYVAARTMQLRTYEVKGWPILVLLLIIRTSTQEPEPTGTEQAVRYFLNQLLAMSWSMKLLLIIVTEKYFYFTLSESHGCLVTVFLIYIREIKVRL